MTLRRRKQHHGGFTLLELMMVVIIIAILASLALPQYIKVSERARAAEAIQTLAGIRASEIRYKAQDPDGAYTDAIGKLDFDVPNSTIWGNTVTFDGVSGNGNTAKGSVGLTRASGAYGNTILGITFGSGKLCGTYNVVMPVSGLCAAAAD